MLYNQILVMLRSLLKNKVYVSINIIGLSFAMACCVVAFWLVKHDILFDAHHTNGDQIYRVGQLRVDDTFPKKFGRVPVPIAEAFRNNYSNFPSTRFYHSYSNVKVGEDLFSPNIYYVDQDFFTMFSFPTVEGTIQFPHKNSVLLTENMAIKLFGSPKEAMGKTLLQIYGTEEKEFVVTGVLKEQPSSSSFYNEHGTTFVLFDNCKDEHKSITVDNWNSEFSFYFQIPDPNVLEGIHKFFGSLIENNNRVRKDFPLASFPLDQFSVMARADRSDNTLNQTHEPPSSAMLMAVIIMGTLMFLIGTFNLVNTVVAISSKRLKEIGVRKVMGGNRFSLVLQFLSESIFIAFLSFLLAVVISIYLTEGWNSLWEEFKLYPVYDVYFWSFILIMSLIVGGLAGIYPALYISSFDPTVILKGNQKFGGASFLSKILLGGQFAISIIGVVCSVAIYQNSIYQRDYDYGFNPKSSIIVWLNSSEEVALFKREIEKNPDIISVAGSNSGIFSNYHHSVVSYNQQTLETDIIQVGTNYLSTLDLKLIEGRDFNDESENDQRESIIVTENYVKSFGWDDPIGKQVIYQDSIKLHVIGVVKNVHTKGLWQELQPLMIRYLKAEHHSQLLVSTEHTKVASVDSYLASKWKELLPNRLYSGKRISDEYEDVDEVNSNIILMNLFEGITVLLLSCFGLYTLVSLNIMKRMKEIGVRKTLGATIFNISLIINMEFFIVLGIAFIIGGIISYHLSNLLMSSVWKYYLPVTITSIIASFFFLLVITGFTFFIKVIHLKKINPVDTLRNN